MMQEVFKTFSLQTVGCRLNQYETEKMAAELSQYGFQRVETGERADLHIINTCTVTHKADSDCRQMIKRAVKRNPTGRVVVTGCYVDNDPDLDKKLEGVDVVIGNSDKGKITGILKLKFPELFDHEPDLSCSPNIRDFHGHNRAWVKVSDGCNQACTFCIIPKVRGKLINRPVFDIIDEINTLVDNGYNEIVLTGVHLGHYKNRLSEPQMKNLASLCEYILGHTRVSRIRLSSVEPQTIREELLHVYLDAGNRICRHMHVPLQSGSSHILKLMQRPYDQRMYLERLSGIKNARPDTIIGADVIVGFPGETEDDFNQTRQVVESGLIDYLHVFSYSQRPGSPISHNPDSIPFDVIKKRNAILTAISDDLRAKACLQQVGQTLEVISEHRKSKAGTLYGIADNYIKVKLPDGCEEGKSIIKVKITSSHHHYVDGSIIA